MHRSERVDPHVIYLKNPRGSGNCVIDENEIHGHSLTNVLRDTLKRSVALLNQTGEGCEGQKVPGIAKKRQAKIIDMVKRFDAPRNSRRGRGAEQFWSRSAQGKGSTT